jgi:YD repeat-containing protein
LTGAGARYDALHAQAPVMNRSQSPVDAAHLMLSRHAFKPRLRDGIRHPFPMPALSTVDRRHPRLDPLAMRRSSPQPNATHANVPVGNATVLEPLRSLVSPGPGRSLSQRSGQANPMTSVMTGTGVQPWWTYEERAIPGIGKAMLNVATGNLVVSTMDVDIHEQGIDLALQRVYNSQSLHDANGDDGGDPSIFGNRWTNNFDASIVYNPVAPTITVYDIDGAACVYTSNGSGGWVPCAGVYATLTPTDGTDCTYMWTKPNGTSYWFHADVSGPSCSIAEAQQGQLAQIIGRNSANSISFAYSYSGLILNRENITEIDAKHSDGDTLNMYFGPVGSGINELGEVKRPDGGTLEYLYDATGNLVEVDKPGNNSAWTIPNPPPTLPSGDAPETYAYVSGSSSMQEACGPRCTVAMWNHPNNPNDGGALVFSYNGSLLASWQFQGVLNFKPLDPTTPNTLLQSGYDTKFDPWYTANFDYGIGPDCNDTELGATTMCDSDGHGTQWNYNGNGNTTQTSDFTGTAEGQWITTYQGWDTTNDLTSTTDANGYITKYAYDSELYGNMVQMQLPQMQDITVGGSTITLKPLSYYSYDGHHNITAYCDPVYNQVQGNSWLSNPSNTPCAGGSKTMRLTYATPSPEPYGCLTNIKKPSAYSTDITYNGDGTGTCGVGLPTKVEATLSITQADLSSRQPTQDFGYDNKGNLTSYDKGQGSGGKVQDSWTLSYNNGNRNYERTENDTIPNVTAVLNSFTCHYPDGSVFYTETPSQHAADGNLSCPSVPTLLSGPVTPPPNATAFSYDTDGDQVTIIDHKGGATDPLGTTTTKFYDGMDRLVETVMPHDDRTLPDGKGYECYGFQWMNRHIYDLSMQGGGASSLSIGSVSVVAYGGLYKTEEYLSSAGVVVTCGQNNATWVDVRGSAFDGFGRVVDKYELANGNAPSVINIYDNPGELGLLSETENTVQPGSHQTISYIYDQAQRVQEMDFAGPAPLEDTPRTFTYDPDGRTATIKSPTTGTMTYAYDVDGNKTQQTDPSNENNNAIINYTNYTDGLRKYLSITGPNSPVNQSDALQYSYREDGLLENETAGWGTNVTPGQFTWSYTPGGRELSETDPYDGMSPPPVQINTKYYYNPNDYYPGTVTLQPKQYSYDQFGRVKSLILPEGYQADNYVYDTDDELMGRSTSSEDHYGNMTPNATTNSYIVDARGELLSDDQQGSCSTTDCPRSANGTIVDPPGLTAGNNAAMQWDTRSGQTWYNAYNVLAGVGSGEAGGLNQYQYDNSGRQTQDQLSRVPGSGWTDGPYYYNRTYDAENHVISAPTGPSCNINPNSPCMYHDANLTWGTDGQLRGICQNPSGTQCAQSMDLHWDGNALLFGTTKPQGGSAQTILYVGKLGVTYNGGGFTVVDRNQNGIQEAWHSQTAFGPWNGFSFNMVGSGGRLGLSLWSSTNWGSYYNAGSYAQWVPILPLGIDRADGYTYASFAIQGVRTYDSTSQQWLTPDAFAGDIHNPISQKPFIWNAGNPLTYSDPSGFDVLIDVMPAEVYGLGHIQIIIYNPTTDKGVLLSVQSANGNARGPLEVIEKPIPDVRTLPGGSGNQYFHLSTTQQQDAAIKSVYDYQSQSAQRGAVYNLADNQCDITAQAALLLGGQRVVLNPVPSLNVFTLQVQGAKAVTPSSLPGPTHDSSIDPATGLDEQFEANVEELDQFMGSGQEYAY